MAGCLSCATTMGCPVVGTTLASKADVLQRRGRTIPPPSGSAACRPGRSRRWGCGSARTAGPGPDRASHRAPSELWADERSSVTLVAGGTAKGGRLEVRLHLLSTRARTHAFACVPCSRGKQGTSCRVWAFDQAAFSIPARPDMGSPCEGSPHGADLTSSAGASRMPTTRSAKLNASAKRVYLFGAGRADGKADMKDLLGGKGANLAEMASLGLPVPPGFTITTEVCTAYYANGARIARRSEGRRRGSTRRDRHGRRGEVRRSWPHRCSCRCARARAPRCRA